NLLDGNARVHLWYVPVLLCILALSPVYLDICRNRPWLAAAIILLPLISSRAGTQFSIRNVMYFGGAYATGMLVGLHFQRLIKFFSPRMLMLLAAAAVSITLLITVAEMQGFPRLVERAYYLQKLMIGLLLLLVLFRLYDGKTVPRFIDYFAASSYAVYLLHFFAIEITLAALAFAVPPQRSTLNALSIGIVCFAVSLLLTALAVRIGTKLFGRYSKLIIGA
ncbi:MAG: acyltransferase family protein, partial [Rhizobiaceae bacterium]|nr:acyltransferase family protein [Rhizobiaceae bacterium]